MADASRAPSHHVVARRSVTASALVTAPRIVVVSRRPKTRDRWARALDGADVSVAIARSLTEVARHEDVSLVVLDCPGDPEDAVRQCARARAIRTNVRLVVIARHQGTLARARLFETGADGILLHPFATRELVACVRAMLRAAAVSSRAALEGKAREPVTPTAKLARELSLTETEHLLLECLGSCPMLTRTQILETVFPGTHYRADSSHLRVHLHRLRAKLRSARLTVKTVYGRGYRLLPLDVGGHAPRIGRPRGVAHARPGGQTRSLVMRRDSHGEVRTC